MASSATHARTLPPPGEIAMWALLGTLAVGLLVAFWTLCSQQVEKAQARDAHVQMQRVALGDCLSYMPRATFNTCSGRTDSGSQAPQASAMAVNFTFR